MRTDELHGKERKEGRGEEERINGRKKIMDGRRARGKVTSMNELRKQREEEETVRRTVVKCMGRK